MLIRSLILWVYSALLLTIFIGGCDDTEPNRSESGRLVVQVSLPERDRSQVEWTALTYAAEDLSAAVSAMSGAGTEQSEESGVTTGRVTQRVIVTLSPERTEELGIEGYTLKSVSGDVEIDAVTALGAAYGLYHLAGDLGALYIHPEETHLPSNPDLRLPTTYDGSAHTPYFKRRGFHEHTQHPIVMSEYLLRPEVDGYRDGVSRYLRWLLRNRQNTLSFHLLNTINFDAWLPYLTSITTEADGLGIDVGFVTGFVDQQQNAFRLVMPDDERAPEQQIIEKLDQFTATGISFIGFQIGTSEFTKPDEAEMLNWLNLAMGHLAMTAPELSVYTWIHITCGLELEEGGSFYHLPLQADERIGAWVHTTMFYTLDHPAPVYDCHDFTHQRDFLDAANGSREQVFFPETAWWLGFDNHVPLVNPITGRSREYDILDALPSWDISGHVTFTTGREWTYWQYDHYLTYVTWDGELRWNDYLTRIEPAYGDRGRAVSRLIRAWGDLQWRDLYEDFPEIYFYLAGELPQDELGEQAGVIARQPKRSYRELIEMSESAFEAWRRDEFEMLERMRDAYQDLLTPLPELEESEQGLYAEVVIGYRLFVMRIEHAIALYRGVISARAGNRTEAEQHHSDAISIGQEAVEQIRRIEGQYRYPLELLTAELPESRTAYPFGAFHETSTGYFWIRREEQLAQLILDLFDAVPEEWGSPVQGPLYVGIGENVSLVTPMSLVLQGALGGFIPRVLVSASSRLDQDEGSADTRFFLVGQDYNVNAAPDPDTVIRIAGDPIMDGEEAVDQARAGWRGTADQYPLLVRDASGVEIGRLILLDARFSFEFEADQEALTTLWLEGDVTPDEVIELVTSVAGIEAAALGQLIKNIWGIPATNPLPDRLPLKVKLPLSLLETP